MKIIALATSLLPFFNKKYNKLTWVGSDVSTFKEVRNLARRPC